MLLLTCYCSFSPQLKETEDSKQDQLQASSKADLLALEDKKADEQKSSLADEIGIPSYVHKEHHLGISELQMQNGGSSTTDLVTENPATAGEGVELIAVNGVDANVKADTSEEAATRPSEHATKL